MTEKQLLSTIKYVAGIKPVFLLREIIQYLDNPLPVDQIFGQISPHLKELQLKAKKIDKDYQISRVTPAIPYILNAREREETERFFAFSKLPEAVERGIEDYISKKVGKDWSDPVILERLHRAIVAQKDDYWKPADRRSLNYTKGYAVLGYLAYHFPVYFMQTEHIFSMLARDGLIKKEMTILDIGTGPGVVPFAIADFYSRLEKARATIWSVERSEEHIEAFTYLASHVATAGSPVTIQPPIKADIAALSGLEIPDGIDLMILSNVANELPGTTEERAALIRNLTERLAPDGTILIVEPAEEVTSTGLRTLSLALKKEGLTIFSPCTFMHGTNCTPDRCWSFVTAPPIHPTQIMNALAGCSERFRYVNTDIKYSYAILRKVTKTRLEFRVPAGSRVLRLSRIQSYVGKRVNFVAAKMSEELGDKKTHMYRLCDGSAMKPVFGVLPSFHKSAGNETIISAPYGAILEFGDVLVRYNPAHDAYNMLVSRNSRVRIVG